MYDALQPYQILFDINDIIEAKTRRNEERKKRDEDEKRKKEEEDKKFHAFSGHGYVVDEQSQNIYDQGFGYEDMDDELRQAMQLSLEEFVTQSKNNLPPEPKDGGYLINIRYENQVFTRRFNDNDTVAHVVMYVQSQIKSHSPIQLFEPYPLHILDESKTLSQSNISRNQFLMCKVYN